MKRFIKTLALSVVAIAFVSANAMAYQLTLSPSGERTQSRNATQGTVDAAYYNPAGLVNLDEGFYVDIGNRMLYLSKETEVSGQTSSLTSETFTPLLPNIALVWRAGAGALYFTTAIHAGGAGGLWDGDDELNIITGGIFAQSGGTINIIGRLDAVEGTTYTIGYTLGGAARINDMVAISGGVRLHHKMSDTEYRGVGIEDGTYDHLKTERGMGWAGVFGIMITPMEGLNIAVNVLTEGYVKSETHVERHGSADVITNTSYLTSPMVAIGIGYAVTDQMEVQFSYNIDFAGDESVASEFVYDEYDNDTHAIAVGAEFRVMDMLLVSGGIKYETTSGSSANNTDFSDPQLHKIVYGVGAVLTPIENLNIDVAFAVHQYLEGEGQTAGTATVYTHNQLALVAGLGVSFSF